MAAQKGKDLLVKIGVGEPETFETVAGLRTRSITFNATNVDITNADSAGEWRELLGGAGVKSATIAGAGVFRDAASDSELRSAFFAQALRTFQIVIPDFGTVAGLFRIQALEYGGAHDGEVTISMTLASAGALTFTAA